MAKLSFQPGDKIKSPVSRKTYTLIEKLGQGGFGAAYRARQGRSELCVKITSDEASWHREAYMAELLHGHPRVVKVHETFPVIGPRGLFYAVAMELAIGTVADAIKGGGWPEDRVTRQSLGLLTAVARLHDSGAVHRDITPYNVFVCGPNNTLKLGDFGIARHGLGRRGLPAGTFAPWFVDTDIYAGSQTRWTWGDDLWQVGQVAAVLLTGELRPVSTQEVKELPCSDALKFLIRRAIGEPSVRFADAHAMETALSHPRGLSFGRLRKLEGRTVVFTGPLGRDLVRRKATRLAQKAGATVLPDPSGSMDVLVVGDPSPNWIAGTSGGMKVLETMALQDQGHRITLVTGERFRTLVGFS